MKRIKWLLLETYLAILDTPHNVSMNIHILNIFPLNYMYHKDNSHQWTIIVYWATPFICLGNQAYPKGIMGVNKQTNSTTKTSYENRRPSSKTGNKSNWSSSPNYSAWHRIVLKNVLNRVKYADLKSINCEQEYKQRMLSLNVPIFYMFSHSELNPSYHHPTISPWPYSSELTYSN